MNNKEITRYYANGRAADFLDKNNDELSGIPLYAGLKSAFDIDLLKVHDAMIKQAKQIKPITKNKNRLRLVMAETMVKFLQRAAVQCHETNNVGLEKAFSKGKTYFTRGKDSEAPVKAGNLKDLIIKHHDILTIITNDDIIEMETAINSFDDYHNLPKEEINDKRASATLIIPPLLNNLDTLKKHIGKLIHSYLPHLAHAWEVTIKVGHSTAIRHLSLIIKIVDSVVNVPLRKVKCTISNGKDTHVKYSTRRGSVRFKSLQDNLWNITIEHPTHQTETRKNIPTFQNKITRLLIPLQKNPIAG